MLLVFKKIVADSVRRQDEQDQSLKEEPGLTKEMIDQQEQDVRTEDIYKTKSVVLETTSPSPHRQSDRMEHEAGVEMMEAGGEPVVAESAAEPTDA